ncbi:unnamed protein product [Euphydryas editha]|uniref:Zinc finger BED domain-containing protein 4 n=1 Tax=Euphydryas editha TaxID=104508 RepID=A0AAU9UNP8_EUPED|nr:unnamed protein product [Euphydryas editha]
MDVVTRWNSTLDMIERICSLQEPLEASLGILHNPVENLSEGEWQTLPEVIKILKPFKQLTEEMSSGNNVTISMVLASIESMSTIFKNLETNASTDSGKKLTNKIITEFKRERVEPNENESTSAVSTDDTDANNDSIWKDFDALATSASASNSTVSSSIITMRQYLEERIIPRNECPFNGGRRGLFYTPNSQTWLRNIYL